jgi:flagellar basal-body rod modification protein FlgD
MTTTTATNNTSSTGALTSLAAGNSALNTVNFDTFLKLLVTQLRNQDPLNPLEGTEFTGQIAQFSSLEQQINSNNYLKEILAQRDFGEQTLANSYLGKEVLGPGNLFIKTGNSTSIGYELSKAAANTSIEIIDNQTGAVVRTAKGETSTGKHLYNWDGKTDAGIAATGDTFTLRLKATDADGKTLPSQGYTFGRVKSIFSDGTEVALQMSDGRAITVSSVMGVRE